MCVYLSGRVGYYDFFFFSFPLNSCVSQTQANRETLLFGLSDGLLTIASPVNWPEKRAATRWCYSRPVLVYFFVSREVEGEDPLMQDLHNSGSSWAAILVILLSADLPLASHSQSASLASAFSVDSRQSSSSSLSHRQRPHHVVVLSIFLFPLINSSHTLIFHHHSTSVIDLCSVV